MANVKDFIAKEVLELIFDTKGLDFFRENKNKIEDLLDKLQPDKPKDGTEGFIAYNVNGDGQRMKTKTGRFLSKKLKLSSFGLTEQQIQNFTQKINDGLFSGKTIIKLCKGAEITENYREEIGGHSCMTGECADYTKLYEQNPDKIQQLVIKQVNDSARAIVYKLDNGKFLMSRVYATCELLKDKMVEYAEKHNWFYQRGSHFICNKSVCDKNDYQQFIVSGLKYRDGEIPYFDSLRGYKINAGLMTVMSTAIGDYDGILGRQEGYLEDRAVCYHCSECFDEDEVTSVFDETVCNYCFNEFYFYCNHCDEVASVDDGNFVEDTEETVCISCAEQYYYFCPDCDNYYSSLVSVDNDCQSVCENCLGNYFCCDNCGEYFSKLNDKNLCEDCEDIDESE